MPFKHFVAAAISVMLLLCLSALGQAKANNGSGVFTNLASGHTNLLLMYSRPVTGSGFETNSAAVSASRARSLSRSSIALPKPGVYKTEPYACIVIVPGKQADDQSVMKPPEPGSAMPVIRPDLRFIPVASK